MKYLKKIIPFFLIILPIIILVTFYHNSQLRSNLLNQVSKLADSLNRIRFDKSYLYKVFNIQMLNSNKRYSINDIKVYTITDGTPTNPKDLSRVLRAGRKKLIIRYNEIGCNSCSDSTFSILKKYDSLKRTYDIYVLVYFSNYDAYLKWRKVEELNYPVLWIKKNTLPFPIEKRESTYIFNVSPDLKFYNFFLPNSRYPDLIYAYFESLL